MEKIQCKECGYENEPERVYCHNCGIKLDRTLVPKIDHDARRKKEEKTKKAKQRSQNARRDVGTAVKMVIYSFIVACLISAVSSPDDVPELKSRENVDALPILYNLDDAVSAAAPVKLTYSEGQVNDYLRSVIKTKASGAMGEYNIFVRVFTGFSDGEATINTEQSVFGRPIFCSATYAVVEENGNLEYEILGGRFGRLPVPAPLMQFAAAVFNKVWVALDHEAGLLEQFATITFEDKRVTLVSAGR